ncbi:MAG TPA: HD domain-containing protein [Chthoniobacterales bacterium]|jgi:5'-deoxynucleotidase YfbR-like HD superfamily hydrolase/nucleoside phosphorylase
MLTTPDFTVVIALREEFREFVAEFRTFWPGLGNLRSTADGFEPDDEMPSVYSLNLPCADGSVAHGTMLLINEAGPFRALDATKAYLQKATPRLLVNIGISGILSDDLHLGDVVVATTAVQYADNLKTSEAPTFLEGLSPGNEWRPTTEHIWNEYAHFETRRQASFAFWQAAAIDQFSACSSIFERTELESLGLSKTPPRIHHGKVASGPFVIASRDLKTWLLERVDRKLLCADQESAEVLRAAADRGEISTLVLRGISDGADPAKGALERLSQGSVRKWALWNAVSLFLSMMVETRFSPGAVSFTSPIPREDSTAELVGRLHSYAARSFLRPPYDLPPEGSAVTYQIYSRFFNAFITSQDDGADNLFERVRVDLERSAVSISYIDGPAGSGKTAFLSVLYWYLRERFESAPDDIECPIPVFVSSSRIEQLSGGAERARALEKYFLDTLQSLLNCAPSRALWVLIDGTSYEDRLAHSIKEVLWRENRGGGRKQIVAVRELDSDSQPNTVISFCPLTLAPDNIEAVVDDFLKISTPHVKPGVKENLLSALGGLESGDLDIYILSQLYQKVYLQGGEIRNLPQFLRWHVRDRLGLPKAANAEEKERILGEVGALAYEMCVRGSSASKPVSLATPLLDEHRFILEYMSARYVIRAYEKTEAGELPVTDKVLGTVYPYSVNRFAKAILNRSGKEDRRAIVFGALGKVIRSLRTSFTAKANACYLAGRFEGDQWKDKAQKLLQSVRSNLEKKAPYLRPRETNTTELKQFLLFARTVHISLAYCGDHEAEARYITQLLNDSAYDRINRGFHLEYYGDIRYNLAEPLVHLDQLQPFPKTLQELSTRIGSTADNPLFDLEVQTLCSLAAQRHVHGKLSDEDRVLVVNIVDSALTARKVDACLEDYTRFVVRLLRKEKASFGRIALSFFELKLTPRSGWRKRGVETLETVGAHTFGAYLLGLLFLPDAIDNEREFNKARVLDMIAVHDLEEAITGDLLPEQKNPVNEEQAKEIMRDLAFLSTLEGVPNYSRISELWTEFHTSKTINAQLARELDKLDNLFELYRLRSLGRSISDFEHFEGDLKSTIRTGVGHKIQDFITARFGQSASAYRAWG